MTQKKPFLSLWAKSQPYKQLLSHMVDTGSCAMQFLSAPSSCSILRFLSQQWHCDENETKVFVGYLAAMHDIGKATPQFQKNNEEQYSRLKSLGLLSLFPQKHMEPIRHEYCSSATFTYLWKQRNAPKRICDSYAAVLSLHHQRENTYRIRIPKDLPNGWNAILIDLENAVRAAFPIPETLLCPQNLDAVCILLTGLIILCDWVASSGPFDSRQEVDEDYMSFSLETALQAMHNYGLIGNQITSTIQTFQSLWPQISTPRDIQNCSERLNFHAPITIIEAPMGEGKTEAALYIAERMQTVWNKRGIYVALPTQATSNQMYLRVKAMLDSIGGGNARLLHGTAFLQNENKVVQVDDPLGKLEAERWLGSLRMGLLDENGIGTVDQAMAGVLKARFSVLRLLGLTNKVLIIDELHAYDAYMSEIIMSLLRWCRCLKIPVILLSATLQESQRRSYLSCFAPDINPDSLLSSYPLITQIDDSGKILQMRASATLESHYQFAPIRSGENCKDIALNAVEQIKNGGCICVLANTVNKAQEIYRALLDIKDNDTFSLLFHARFPIGRREEIEKECLRRFGRASNAERPLKAILVATQVVEQSLDLDFDGMISELAPIDLLLQRAGRVHRHRERKRPLGLEKPLIQVILPDKNACTDLEKRYGNNGYVYAPFLLYNTEKLLENGKGIQVPSGIRSVIETVYGQISFENMKVWQEREFSNQLMRANADGNIFPDPQEDIFFPAESHPEFSQLEVDDGFEPAMRATTRLGEPTFRLIFSGFDLNNSISQGNLSKDQQKLAFLSSVSLPLNRVSYDDLIKSGLQKIEKGVLRGCFLSSQYDMISIGKYVLVNDPIYGIRWKEQSE